MTDHRKAHKIKGTIDLFHRVLDGKQVYAAPALATINVCAGQKDNTSCGPGCTCISQQPYYSAEILAALGIRPEAGDK